MKKTTIIASLLLTLFVTNANGQKVDSTSKVAPQVRIESVKLLSVDDINRLSEPFKKKYTYEAFAYYMAVIQEVITAAVVEYEQKQSAIKSSAKKP